MQTVTFYSAVIPFMLSFLKKGANICYVMHEKSYDYCENMCYILI